MRPRRLWKLAEYRIFHPLNHKNFLRVPDNPRRPQALKELWRLWASRQKPFARQIRLSNLLHGGTFQVLQFSRPLICAGNDAERTGTKHRHPRISNPRSARIRLCGAGTESLQSVFLRNLKCLIRDFPLAHRSFHLKLYKPLEFDRVLHGEFLYKIVYKSVYSQAHRRSFR